MSSTWIILIRGINVGGRNRVPMADLRVRLTDVGFKNVRTYIQSGNVVLDTDEGDKTKIINIVAECIQGEFGFTPDVMVLRADTMGQIIKNNPYPDAESTPKFLHIYFLAEPASEADIDTLNNIKTAQESFHITDLAVYVYLPDGAYNSKLAKRLEKCLGVQATARNWRSANKILDLVV